MGPRLPGGSTATARSGRAARPPSRRRSASEWQTRFARLARGCHRVPRSNRAPCDCSCRTLDHAPTRCLGEGSPTSRTVRRSTRQSGSSPQRHRPTAPASVTAVASSMLDHLCGGDRLAGRGGVGSDQGTARPPAIRVSVAAPPRRRSSRRTRRWARSPWAGPRAHVPAQSRAPWGRSAEPPGRGSGTGLRRGRRGRFPPGRGPWLSAMLRSPRCRTPASRSRKARTPSRSTPTGALGESLGG